MIGKAFDVGQAVIFPTDHKAVKEYKNEILLGFKLGIIAKIDTGTMPMDVNVTVIPFDPELVLRMDLQVRIPGSMLIQVGDTEGTAFRELMNLARFIKTNTKLHGLKNKTFEELIEESKRIVLGLKKHTGGKNL